MNSPPQPSPIVPNDCGISSMPMFSFPLAAFPFPRIPTKRSSRIQEDSLPKESPCQCPRVLISDDDDFQGFYYRALFKKAVKLPEIVQKDDEGVRVIKSGEDLLGKYCKQKMCNCKAPKLVITDYDMGESKLNGIETAIKLRKVGYDGPIILRTSETRDKLKKNHPYLSPLLQEKVIDYVLSKNSHQQITEVIHKFYEKLPQ